MARSTTANTTFTTSFKALFVFPTTVLIVVAVVVSLWAQADPTDADLERLSSRSIAIGALSSDRHVTNLPLELYVARVLAGEAEADAPDGELQALAIAIRTFTIFNAGRHGRDGFDLCDTTHCQVPRAATAATRRAAMATAGRILTWHGLPAEIFYSASCGGRSASANDVWPGADLPYLTSVADDVHEDDVPWTIELSRRDVQQAMAKAGFEGTLRDLRIEARNSSGRVARLHLSGMRPDTITGEQFRMALGPREFRSTAFAVDAHGQTLRFTGRGYGHGVGMCVIGAGRRARRGETVEQILAQYYPGLAITPLAARSSTRALPAEPAPASASRPVPAIPGPPASTAASVPVSVRARGAVTNLAEVERVATEAYAALSKTLGTSTPSITIQVHDTLDSFRGATNRPWWVNAVADGTGIDLAPPSLLAQRDGLEPVVRRAIAELLMASSLAGRPVWVRVGGARYLTASVPPAAPSKKVTCPADAELTLAVSAVAQREAEMRAEQCFARGYTQTRDWRLVK